MTAGLAAWVGIEGDEIVLATTAGSAEAEESPPRPAHRPLGPVDHDERVGFAEYLAVYGTAQVTEGGAAEVLQRLAYTYIGPDVVFPNMTDPPPGFVTRITPQRIGGVGPWNPARR